MAEYLVGSLVSLLEWGKQTSGGQWPKVLSLVVQAQEALSRSTSLSPPFTSVGCLQTPW